MKTQEVLENISVLPLEQRVTIIESLLLSAKDEILKHIENK